MAAALAAAPLHIRRSSPRALASSNGQPHSHTPHQLRTKPQTGSIMKALVLVLLLSACSSLALAWYEYDDTGSGRPYHYGEESFRHWTRSRQGRFRVLERFTHELLEDAVGNYRVAELEAAPRAFLQPSHYDADEVMFVKEGEGVVVLLRGGRRESFCVREGDVLVIPAGAVVYSANTHRSEWFRVVMLLSPVSTSGRFEEFFPIGGDNPESFLGVFSDDVIQASFNTRREEWEKVFEKQSKGEITTASEEQIRELSRSCSRSRGDRSSREGGDSGSSSSSSKWEIKPSSLTGKRPTHSNSHGRHYEITGDECPHLRVLDMKVGLTNISRGSMMTLSYNTRAHKIAIVVDGDEGFFEMACPHVSGGRSPQRRGEEEEEREEEQGGRGQKSRSYKQVKSRIREGSVIVIPAGHPTALVAGEDSNLAVVCFEVNANFDEKVFLAGANSALQQMDGPAKLLAFGADEEEKVDRVIGAQKDAVFLRGPRSRRRVSSA